MKKKICVFWYIVLVDLAAGFLLSLFPSSALFSLLTGGAGTEALERSIVLWLTIVIRVFEFSVMLYWLECPARDLLSEFGLRQGLWKRGLAAGAVAAAVLGGGFFVCNAVLSTYTDMSLVERLGLAVKQPYESVTVYRFSYIAAACISASFFEDIFFIGLLFGALRNRFPLPAAFFLGLAHFTAAHVIVNLLPVMSGGSFVEIMRQALPQIIIWIAGGSLFLGLYARFKTLLPSMIVHGIGNLIIFLV